MALYGGSNMSEKEISEKINRMPLRYFDTKTHGEVL